MDGKIYINDNDKPDIGDDIESVDDEPLICDIIHVMYLIYYCILLTNTQTMLSMLRRMNTCCSLFWA